MSFLLEDKQQRTMLLLIDYINSATDLKRHRLLYSGTVVRNRIVRRRHARPVTVTGTVERIRL